MRIVNLALAASAAALLLAGCGARDALAGRDRPDEFAVARNAPLVVPPDFTLAPPRPGQPQPVADSRTQALEALFGGPAPRSESERQLLDATGADGASLGARSTAGDLHTVVVDKGQVTQTILAVPSGNGQQAQVSTPQ